MFLNDSNGNGVSSTQNDQQAAKEKCRGSMLLPLADSGLAASMELSTWERKVHEQSNERRVHTLLSGDCSCKFAT